MDVGVQNLLGGHGGWWWWWWWWLLGLKALVGCQAQWIRGFVSGGANKKITVALALLYIIRVA